MLDQAKMLWKANQVRKELKNTEIEAKSNDGSVSAVVNGEMRLVSIDLNPEKLNPDNKKNLERAIQNTISEALSKAQAVAAEKTKDVMKDLNINIPGM
jgi:hypothetical protein